MKRTLPVLAVLAALAVPAYAAPTDRKPPEVRVTTPDGATRVSAPGPAHQAFLSVGTVVVVNVGAMSVAGTASDLSSGVERVTVVYCPGSRSNGGWTCQSSLVATAPTSRAATLSCTNAARRQCTWKAAPPDLPGRYLVFAEARDLAGNRAGTGPVEILVV
jgi:hypothetical protein